MGAIVRDGLKCNDVICMLLHCIVLKGGSKYIYCVSHLFTESYSRRIRASGVACVKE